MRAIRLPHQPVITPASHPSLGRNINGPSLIRVPDWLPHPLGRYYLYFAHHQGLFIRLAYAERIEGPYSVYEPGTLRLEETPFHDHIASPDVHIDETRRELRMYYHGPCRGRGQSTTVAHSKDGLAWTSRTEIFGPSYFRVFAYEGWWYALAMSEKRTGPIFRSKDGLTGFEPGPEPFRVPIRHNALMRDGDTLSVFYSVVGDRPEHIVWSTIDLRGDWRAWTPTPPVSLLKPELPWEGADCPHEPSVAGWAAGPVWQLRDPGIYREGGRTWLVYAIAGEQGLAIAELVP